MARLFEHGYALLIAVNENSTETAALPDVIKDVDALYQVLSDKNRCAFSPKNIKRVVGKGSTHDGIYEGLDWLQEMLAADDSGEATVVVYFTGHGHTEDGDYFLVPHDVKLNRIASTSIRAKDFAKDIAALRPRRLLVLLDCCHAAGMGAKELPPALPFTGASVPPALFMSGQKSVDPAAGKNLQTLAQGEGRAVLNSCRAEEKSWIRKDGKMSIFTYHLIEALTGHAQPKTGAIEVLVSDIASHLYRRVPESAEMDWHANQNPWCEVSGNFPVALLLGGKGLGAGEIPPVPEAPAAVPVAHTSYHAVVRDGAAVQGPNARAYGKGAVVVEGNNSGNLNTGTQINTGGGTYVEGSVTTGRDFIGRDKVTHTHGSSGAELDTLFATLMKAVVHQAPAPLQNEAIQQVQALRNEAGKGKHGDDGKLAKIVDGLVGLVPKAAGAIVNAFASPLLDAVSGQATKSVLEKLRLSAPPTDGI